MDSLIKSVDFIKDVDFIDFRNFYKKFFSMSIYKLQKFFQKIITKNFNKNENLENSF